ncbi:MAG TPA: cation diffusion facilitator family transporter [Caulobacteraceae bacterium]|jgi:cation diffusion facilitator family transporter|nr:cation diffusion facilitator family transporter [Caulobacteraceae bacterium]
MTDSVPTSAKAAHGTADLEQYARATRRVTLYSVTVALVLIVLKAVVWQRSGSVALFASLADSTLDLVAALVTFFAVRYAAAPPDAEHRFGHGKAESFASLLQAGLVFASGALVGREALLRLLHPQAVGDGGEGTAVMAVSIVLTAGLLMAQTRALKSAGSVAVESDRAHYFMDLLSNLVALVGIAGATFLHLRWLDGAAGLAVAATFLWGAVGVFRQSAYQLMDESLPPGAHAQIVDLVTKDPRITGVHQLRTRVSGPYVMMQMHADLDPHLTLDEAHKVMIEAEDRILAEYPAADIIIHPDPRGRAAPHGGAFAEHAHVDA